MATAKAYKGIGMEGAIATWYAKNTAEDRDRFTDTARLVSERTSPGGAVLEVAPGPGFLAIELAKRGYRMTTVDISATFVRIARENAGRAGVTTCPDPVHVHRLRSRAEVHRPAHVRSHPA